MKYLTSALLVCLFMSLQSSATAQNIDDKSVIQNPYTTAKGQSDIGLSLEFSSYNGLDLLVNYRYAITNKLFLRTNLSIPHFRYGNPNFESNIAFAYIGVRAGLEYHQPIAKRWSIYLGAEVGADISRVSFPTTIGTRYINAIFGVDYQLNKKVSLFAEVSHQFGIRTIKPENQSSYKDRYSFTKATIGMRWKLGKKNK